MDNTELCYTPATDLVKMIKAREISPTELVKAVLERIEVLNPKINAYCTIASKHALKAAEDAEKAVMKKEKLGALHGIPVSIKDLTPTRGIRTTYGSKLYENHIPDEDALIVQRLKTAGAVVIGKTNTPELGAGINTTNKIFGTTLNPWDLTRTPGGSSGGAAAALAAGLAPIAEGSDLGGSMRIPASYCGVVGFRTTSGLIPKYPAPWAWDEFSVTGPMARTVKDTALMLSTMAGPDDIAPMSLPNTGFSFDEFQGDCKGLHAAWSPDLGGICKVDPEIKNICASTATRFQELGISIEEASPDFNGIEDIISSHRIFRTAVLHGDLLNSKESSDNPIFNQFFNMIDGFNIMDLAAAERRRTKLWANLHQFFKTYDLLICPTTSTPAFSAEKLHPSHIGGEPIKNPLDNVLLTYALSMTTLPAISVPAGWTKEGLPVGIQIVGRRFAEKTVLRAAANFEKIAPWADRRPDV